jgi:sec-independent protein translocase protein TatA
MFEGLLRGEHLLIILAIVVLVFPGKVAHLGGSLGKTIRDFKKALNEPDPAPASGEPRKSLPER